MLAGDFDRAANAFSDAWTVVRRQERFASGHRIIISWARCLRRLDYTSEDRAWLELKSRWADLCFQQGFSERAFRHAAGVMKRSRQLPRALLIEVLLADASAKVGNWRVNGTWNECGRHDLAEEPGDG